MLFGRHKEQHRKVGFGVLGVLRLILSLAVLVILLAGVYAAYRAFSPQLPSQRAVNVGSLMNDPEGFLKNILTQDGILNFAKALLEFSPPSSLNEAKKVLGQEVKPVKREPNPGAGSVFKFRFAVVSDSHNDSGNLKRALEMAKTEGARFVVGLGDYTDVGTAAELQDAKTQFDQVGLPYYLAAGDHDLWDARNRGILPSQNFSQVFGPPYKSFSYGNTRVIVMYNSDNYLGIDEVQKKWAEDELRRAQGADKLTLVFIPIPLYHPSSDHVMGKVNEKLKVQAEDLAGMFSKYNVAEVISGDAHLYSRFTYPSTSLRMATIGAVTSARNLQAPRFAFIDVYEDGGYNIEDREIK